MSNKITKAKITEDHIIDGIGLAETLESRAHRIGQTDSVNSIFFLGRNTIDEYIYDIIDRKRAMVASVTGSEEVVQESVINDLINLFNQKK